MNNSVSTMSGKTKIKIVFLGNQNVGKSSIIEKYVKDVFDETANPTVGIDFLVKNVTHQTKSYRLQLWDTAGQQRFRSLIPNYLKDAKCALIVIDVTNRATLNSAENWLKLYNDNRTIQGTTFMIGNKIDLEYREIGKQEAKKKAQELGLIYFQISAKTGQNIERLFTCLIDSYENRPLTYPSPSKKAGKDNQVIREEDEDTEVKQKPKKNPEVVINPNSDGTSARVKNPDGQDAVPQNIVLKNQQIGKNDPAGKKKNCC